MKVVRRSSAFTLLELLVVIAILGVLAGLAVPALKNLGKSNASVSASRQFLDDIGYARQLAISGHRTVYMVFLPTNYWGNINWLLLTQAQRTEATNLAEMQLSGYNFVSLGQLGDQPGQHAWHYLSNWRSLPAGFMIDAQKFILPGNTVISSQANPLYSFWNQDYPHADQNVMYPFVYTTVPFPDAASTNNLALPCIAFSYQGQLTSGGTRDEYIPLAAGSVSYALDPVARAPLINGTLPASAISQTLPGNSTNISYNIVHIDALTGRATLEFHHVQ